MTKKIIFACLGLFPVLAFAQVKYTISGSVKSSSVHEKAYLTYKLGTQQYIDSMVVKKGKFAFKGNVPEEMVASLVLKHDSKEASGKKTGPDALTLFLEKGKIKVLSQTDSLHGAQVVGGKSNSLYQTFRNEHKVIMDKKWEVEREYYAKPQDERNKSDFLKYLQGRFGELSQQQALLDKTFIQMNRNTFAGLYVYATKLNISDSEHALQEFGKFSPELQQSYLGKNIETALVSASKKWIGTQALDFSQEDIEGNNIRLSDFRGQYVLIDFWASWCQPCRVENPNLVKAYNTFKNRNFTILGVSLDQPGKKDAWLNAIKQDGLTWTNVSDLKFWDNEAAKLYGIRSVPANFLIDPQGNIVAKDIRGEELQKRLEELLPKQ